MIILKFNNNNNNNAALQIVANLKCHSGIFVERRKKTVGDS
jgi:hypothetical protein